MSFDALLLAGGAAKRLGGRPKPTLEVGGRRLVDVAVAAVAGADRVVLVGPDPGELTDVVVLQEDPPGGGPVAAIAAGLPRLAGERVVVLACDLPYVTSDVVQRLLAGTDDCPVAVLTDDADRDQLLVAAWRRSALATAVSGADPVGRSVRTLLTGLQVHRVRDDGERPAWYDCDTPEQLDEARRRS